MARDNQEESHHCKHRRSSNDDEVDKSSKRHKHRQSKHHHRHHRDKKEEEEGQCVGGDIASLTPLVPVRCDDGVEEGEILEEADFDEVEKQKLKSDGESGEIKSGEFRNKNLLIDHDTHPPDEHVDDKNYKGTHPKDLLAQETCKENILNGDVSSELRRVDKRRYQEFGSPSKENGKKSDKNSDKIELDKCLYSNKRSLIYSESSGEKYKNVANSSSDANYSDEVRACSRSRSQSLVRGRSQSRSIVDDEFFERRRYRSSSRDYHGKSEEKYNNYGTYEEHDRRRAREMFDFGSRRDIEVDGEERRMKKEREGRRFSETGSDWGREREREKRREIEDDRDRRRERDRGYSRERERMGEVERHRIKDRDSEQERNWNKDRVHGERERNRDRDRAHSERDRHRDRNGAHGQRDRYGERDGRRSRYHSREREKKDCEKKSLHSEYDAEDDRTRTDSFKSHRFNDESKQEDNEKSLTLELPEVEEEELNRIKEESRKRKQAILEKYKNHQIQQHDEPSVELKGKDSELAGDPDQSCKVNLSSVWEYEASSTIISEDVRVADVVQGEDADNDCASEKDVVDSEPLLTVEKLPSHNGTADIERASGPAGLGEGTPKSERSADMFSDDIFGESPAGVLKKDHLPSKGDGVPLVRSGLNDNWDDAEGYYSYQFGELLDGRYEVIATHGKGVFSTVVRAKDLKAGPGDPEEVAIKIIRNNETMHKAGQTEVQILKKLTGADPEKRRHCVLYVSSFKYRNHLCLVFESLHLNLREVLKKFGRNIGLNLTAVRAYAKQLFIALKHLKNCGILHCDLKPDNMLVNEEKNVLKLCDFGNAMFAGKNEVTPYLVSRFYRAPEIILGLPYDHSLDMWSVGCCLYELYSGKVLFPGATNNDMLRLHIELKGPFPKKMLRKGGFVVQHFDQDLNFHATEEDPVIGKTIRRMLMNSKPKDIGSIIKVDHGEDPKMLAHFKDLFDKIFTLDPDRRLTVSRALAHPFITGK